MRLISRDLKHSIDYERSHLFIDGDNLYAQIEGKSIVLGRYDGNDGVSIKDVFEKIHENYVSGVKVCVL